MFSENEKISQRQMERQIVLVLLCPAFWQLAAYGAADGIPGIAGIFLGYVLLGIWCIYLVRLCGVYQRIETVAGKTGKVFLAIIYLGFLLLTGGTLLQKMAELSSVYLTAGISKKVCALFLAAVGSAAVGTEVQKRGRLAEFLHPWIWAGILVLLFLTIPELHREAFKNAWEQVRTESVAANGIRFRENLYRTLESGTPLAFLPFLLPYVQKRPNGVMAPLTRGIWKTGLLLLFGSIALLGVFGQRGTAASEDPLLLLMAGTSLPGGFLERFDILWMAILLTGLLFALGSLLFYVSWIGEKTGLWKEKNNGIRIGAVLIFWLLSWKEEGWRLRYGCFPFFLGITILLGLQMGQRKRDEKSKNRR